MKQDKMEKLLKKKVELNDKPLSEALSPEDYALVSFWSAVESFGISDEDAREILDRYGGNAKQALSSLL